jgi:hypothetical protein
MATGYGVDVSLTDKLVTGRLVSGKAVVIEALYRRLITPRGSLFYDLTYGFDVSEFVGAVGYERARLVIAGMVANELAKDDRVINVTCTATLSEQSSGQGLLLTLDVAATLAAEDEDFSFTVGVTETTTELLATS